MTAGRGPDAGPGPDAGRQAAWRRGCGGEALAAWWLRLKGYRIVARGLRTPAGELDLVARRGRILAFVEVKARPDLEAARAAISPRQRRRIARAAEAFLQQRPAYARLQPRFDAVLIAPGRRPRHLVNAWDQSGHDRWSAAGRSR